LLRDCASPTLIQVTCLAESRGKKTERRDALELSQIIPCPSQRPIIVREAPEPQASLGLSKQGQPS